ncbi:hypothetical protein E4U02_07595 [Microbacterium paludicola]|uniref:Type II secretion system protein GspF domain-containing protein n=1 Tax=Microbacterium paludicola TaxID=300019 RepID=A0A4Y9FXV0_9MICO|nr:type II secretion system F family protein [Microbacterium paludicola]MBF0816270.1 type II secretion system F family protein [Microbacterium paludicola]TFU33071.1 hypothetical protein E4U02_07595 [Microbacterium paludicola]
MNDAGLTLSILLAVAGVIIAILAAAMPESGRKLAIPASIRHMVEVRLSRQQQLGALAGLVAGVGYGMFTGWWIMIAIGVGAGIVIPVLLGKGDAPQRIARLEALETWTRGLAGLTVAGAGLEATLEASRQSAPEAIREEVTALVARINARWPTKAALQRFAEDLDDGTADMVVAHLLMKESARGDGLAEALDDLGEIIFEETKVRRQILTDRAKPRTHITVVAVGILVVAAALPLLGNLTAWYLTPLGTVVLAAWMAAFVALVAWMRSISRERAVARIFTTDENGGLR